MDFNKALQKLRESTANSEAEKLFRRYGLKINKVIESKTAKKNDPYDSILSVLERKEEWKKFQTKNKDQFIFRNSEDKSEVFLNLKGKDDLGFLVVHQ